MGGGANRHQPPPASRTGAPHLRSSARRSTLHDGCPALSVPSCHLSPHLYMTGQPIQGKTLSLTAVDGPQCEGGNSCRIQSEGVTAGAPTSTHKPKACPRHSDSQHQRTGLHTKTTARGGGVTLCGLQVRKIRRSATLLQQKGPWQGLVEAFFLPQLKGRVWKQFVGGSGLSLGRPDPPQSSPCGSISPCLPLLRHQEPSGHALWPFVA